MHLDIGHFGIKVEFAQFHVEFFGIKFGANGAGKSTAIKLLIGELNRSKVLFGVIPTCASCVCRAKRLSSS